MEPKALHRIVNVRPADRNTVIAEGMQKLAEHVAQLDTDATLLQEQGRSRGRAVLDIFAAEQAASYLILLDLARGGWTDSARVHAQIKGFNNHLARGLYLVAYDMKPADLAEIDNLLRLERRSHFLDGPNDVDWVFRREIEDNRESTLYVDFVAHESETRWISPADWRAEIRQRYTAVKLVGHLSRLGMDTSAALDIAAAKWKEVDFKDMSLHWQTVRRINADVIAALPETHESEFADRKAAINLWIHPLNGLDLTPIKVETSRLREQALRARVNYE